MIKLKRKRYLAKFKAQVALEEIKGKQTIQELGAATGSIPNKPPTGSDRL